MNLIFCGTPEFAVPTLDRLIREKFALQLVVTNPDESSGRGYDLKPPPVKLRALEAGLPVFQPRRLKDQAVRAFLSQYHPDAIVVIAYGHLIPPWMIRLPCLGCINLHASLLPKYRGAAPIPWAIIRGERVTGLTTMRIDAGLDSGDILLQRETPIENHDTSETLAARMSVAGAELMAETLRRLQRGGIQPRPQEHERATLAPILTKEHGRIDWSVAAGEIERRVRGLRPWPGTYTTFRGRNLHIWKAHAIPNPTSGEHQPGTLTTEAPGLLVACGQGTLLALDEVQLEGRKRIPAREFANGARLAASERLG